ncbi:hypothetical protein [Pseudodesulfovibrio karagichevae]|uniref:Lipoprotein n=1 Tax=Pseudodesulfovibrio karagichevae TaxID=3239305 RepID=A0ABV4K6I4_9BACT
MKRIAILLTMLAVALAGCGPKLQAVRDFSTISIAATEQSQASIGFLNEACLKTQQILVPLEETNKSKEYIAYRVNMKCAVHKTSVEGTRTAITVLTEYFKALAVLSSDSLYKHGGTVQELKAKLKTATGSSGQLIFEKSSAKVDAVFSLADSIIQLGTMAYQKHMLKNYIRESYSIANQTFVQLEGLIGKNCVTELKNQRSAFEFAYYTTRLDELDEKIRSKKLAVSAGELETIKVLYRQDYEKKVSGVEEAITRCQRTAEALTKSRETFKEIYDHLEDLDSDYIRAIVDTYYAEVLPSLRTLQVVN